MNKQMSVILDTSIFHNFDYASDVLYKLKEKSIIRVYISPMLLEESFRLMLYDKATSDIKKRLQFILDISSERWLEDTFEISKMELGFYLRRKDYQFLKVEKEQIVKENMRLFLTGGVLKKDDIHKINSYLKENKNKADNLHEIGYDMRRIVAQKIKGLGKKHKDITETWQDFKLRGLNKWGVGLIRRKGCYSKMFQLFALSVWIINRNRCPYFHDWVQGMLYISFYNMKYPNMKIDKNAQSDIQHLMFLRKVDAIVSEEQKFMRTAWNDIYAPLGKKYFNISEIAKLY